MTYDAIIGAALGPMSPVSAYVVLHHQSGMMFDGNIIPLWIPGGRVILAENR